MSTLLGADPIVLSQQWLADARGTDMAQPDAAVLATVDADGMPSARVILVKHLDARGFVFYTNLGSAKSKALAANPRAALCMHMMPLGRQLRTRGPVEPVSATEADAYFATRARLSQLGAWASHQSEPLANRETLEQRLAHFEELYRDRPVPRPDFWSGFRLVPQAIEFWTQGDYRLHERVCFRRESPRASWGSELLYP